MTKDQPTTPRPAAGRPGSTRPARSGEALIRLAEAYGIATTFEDALGRTVETAPETLRHLLGAMGVSARNDAEIDAALVRIERVEWSRTLPPVAVVSADRPEIAFVVPAGTVDIAWRIDLEGAGRREGRDRVAALKADGAKDLDGKGQERRLLRPGALPPGYHRLTIRVGAEAAPASTTLVAAPARCWLPPVIREGGRLAGLSVQLYLLRAEHDWGIGDFGMLGRLSATAAEHGCDVIGLNPLHAMFPDSPEQASPYSPASRLFLNVLYIDVPSLPEFAADERVQAFAASEEFSERLAACRAAMSVDYSAVTALKLEVLSRLFVGFARDAAPERRAAFEAFREAGGEALGRMSTFLALRSRHIAEAPEGADWRTWPEPFRRPDTDAVRAFADDNRPAIEFLDWLQWLADEQLGEAARVASEAGMTVGLYRDLAVGGDRSGAETWSNPDAVIVGATVGAPPDIFNPAGQNWGLPPFNPHALREEAYRSFIELVRANMRHAGGLRIDHVMGLTRLYCIPEGAGPDAGAYVGYPLEDLVGILALESQRQRCIVVGEDLGTVPEGFRERMEEAAILSYRILFFEQDFDTSAFRRPDSYPHLALAASGSHDLPTVTAWWRGLDIDLKQRLGLYPREEEAADQRERRARDRAGLLAMLRGEGLVPQTGEPDENAVVEAVHAALGRSPSALAVVQIDDMMAETDPVNVPGTDTEHANWRRRATRTLEDLETDASLWTLLQTVRREQAKPVRRAAAEQSSSADPASPSDGGGS